MDGALMRYLPLLAMLMLPIEAGAWGPMVVTMGSAPPYCTLPVSGELGDNDNYLSNWSLTGGPCGVIFYEAEWSEYALDWSIKLYSDAERTRQIGSGIGTGTIAISGTVTGSVTAVSGESAYIQLLGTLTR